MQKKLPWDCKNFMSLYGTEKVRRNIIYKLFESTDTDYKPLEPFMIEIENTTGLSLEAQEFRSHSATGSSHSASPFWALVLIAICTNQLSVVAPCQCFIFG